MTIGEIQRVSFNKLEQNIDLGWKKNMKEDEFEVLAP